MTTQEKISKKKLIAFNYFGGKFSHVDWIIKHLPKSKSYVEVFGGSGVVLLNKPKSKIETLNDLNNTVVNFFKVLRESPEELIRNIFLTPYSRNEYLLCYRNMNEGNELERARKFFVVVGQSFNGSYSRQTGWKMSTKETRANLSGAVSRWLSKIPNLVKVVERLKYVQISNYDFREVFEKFDSPETLFYCDPPYMHETRCNNNEYEFEMSNEDHVELLKLCLNAKGMIALSCYDNEMYSSMLQDRFYKSEAKEKMINLYHSQKKEILWTNYNPTEHHEDLFTVK